MGARFPPVPARFPTWRTLPAMSTTRRLTTPLAIAAASAALAAPAMAAEHHLPGPPTWPKHPQPVTQIVAHPPGPPTWPTDPKPITAYQSSGSTAGSGFDLASAGIGLAGGVLVLTAGAAGGIAVRRRRAGSRQAVLS
jgi:hypothetical protein